MTNSSLTPTHTLKNQRETLRHQRRLKAWQGVWRLIALSSMTGGLMWSITLPHWLIKDKSQVAIKGNQKLNSEQIHKMLEMNYPQFIWKLPIHNVRETLETEPPLEKVYITRQLLPPQVTVMVQERTPVAQATLRGQAGFIDAQGVWISNNFYQPDAKVKPSVNLKVLGLDQHNLEHWKTIYPLILQSPVKITLIDWRDPSNLILHTALGKVHVGTYGQKFSEQLKALGKLSKLSSKVPLERIIYIDLSRPDSPSVHLKNPPSQKNNAS